MKVRWLAPALFVQGLTACAFAQQAESANLGNMSIDDLMKIEVTSASKHAQPLDSAPAALIVITQDDIHRSGARTIVEALRLVPGLQIGRYRQNYYAVTVRGFNNPNFDGSNGNKLLVLLDGRSLYMPYTSSVYWEIEDTLLEDIDRIEVIRGPGGSLYGANAVNGVINIITKSAAATQGGLAIASGGTLEQDRVALQYGWKAGKDASFRVFGKHGNDNQSQYFDGSGVGDQKILDEVGFRGDIDLKKHGSLMVQGAYNRFGINEAIDEPTLTSPYNQYYTNQDIITTSDFLARWTVEGKGGAQTQVQAYYDRLDYPFTNASGTSNTLDFDFQHQFAPSKLGSLTLGAGYRYMINDSTPGPTQRLDPVARRDSIYSFFGQDQIPVGRKGTLTLGLKLEHNTYTGFEFQPSVRYLHQLDDSHTIWGAISRAVRTPSQTELSDHVVTWVDPPANPGDPPTAYTSFGNPSLTSEHLLAYELGYRFRHGDRFSLDLTGFFDVYSDLIYSVNGTPYTTTEFGQVVQVVPTYLRNGESGNVYGAEMEGRWKLANQTFFTLGTSYVQQGNFSQGSSIVSPKYQVFGRLSHDFKRSVKADAMLYWYDGIPDVGQASYPKFDVHVSWKPDKNLELSVGGQDLLFGRSIQSFGGVAIPRSGYVQLMVQF